MKDHNRRFLPITPEEEEIGKAVVNAAYIVHTELGPGLLEKVLRSMFLLFAFQRRIQGY